ncbi:MAG: DUF2975 domain-containing protein [Clostridiales bacterium]|nr:DUF2975 domain-containing protein [Clostridiales bacterium]
MNEKVLSMLTRVAIITIAICGLLSCLFWVPISIGRWDLQNLPWGSIEFSIQYVFHWIVSLPCFGLLIIAWRITLSMNKGKLFLEKNALYVNYATIVLIVDIAMFLIGNIIFVAMGWNNGLILDILVAVLGLVISLFMYVLSRYLKKAAILQEESDYTV